MVARSGQHDDVVVKALVNVVPACPSHRFVLGRTAGLFITPSERMSSIRMNRMLGFPAARTRPRPWATTGRKATTRARPTISVPRRRRREAVTADTVVPQQQRILVAHRSH